MQEPVVTPAQLRAGRALLGLSQAELAERAGLTVEPPQRLRPSVQQVRSSLPWQPSKPLLRVKACSSLMLTADKVLAFDCGVPVYRTRVCDRTS